MAGQPDFIADRAQHVNNRVEHRIRLRWQFRLPIMDDTVITLLSTKTYEDLYTAEGKENLRTEITRILSEKLTDLHILSVYFTEFVVQ